MAKFETGKYWNQMMAFKTVQSMIACANLTFVFVKNKK